MQRILVEVCDRREQLGRPIMGLQSIKGREFLHYLSNY